MKMPPSPDGSLREALLRPEEYAATTLHGQPVDLRDVLGDGPAVSVGRGGSDGEIPSDIVCSSLSLDDSPSAVGGTGGAAGAGWWRLLRAAASSLRWRLPRFRFRGRSSPPAFISSSLAFSPSTPCLLSLLLPLVVVLNHVLFYRAQTAPMWNLAYAAHIDLWANATSFKTKTTCKAVGLPDNNNFAYDAEETLQTFTYMDAINKLWAAEGLEDKKSSQAAAVMLVIFSGVWPHLKLLLLHFTWFVRFRHSNPAAPVCCGPRAATRRKPLLRTISTLGKWSLADVFLVCVMIAVLHLDWTVDPEVVRAGIEAQLPTLLEYAKQKYPTEVEACEDLLGYRCGKHAQVKHYAKCYPCEGVIKNAFKHPDWTTSEGKAIIDGFDVSGGGYAQLRVRGMNGSYLFCGAVVMSIFLSLIVDFMDWRDNQRVEGEYEILAERGEGSANAGADEGVAVGDDIAVRPPSPVGTLNDAFMVDYPLNENFSPASPSRPCGTRNASRVSQPFSLPPRATTNSKVLGFTLMWLFSVLCTPLVYYAVTIPIMIRVAHGGIPDTLHDVLGVVWERTFSVVDLVRTTGDAGSWDNFLMATFGCFVLVGPAVRAALLGLSALLAVPVALLGECVERPRSRTTLRTALFRAFDGMRRSVLLPLADAVGVFCAWEVLIIAVVMVQLEMPDITDTILQDDRCREVNPEDGRTCVEVQFNTLDEFLLLGVAWAVLVAAAALSVMLADGTRGGGASKRRGVVEFEWGQEVRIDDSGVYDPMRQHEGERIPRDDPASVAFV